MNFSIKFVQTIVSFISIKFVLCNGVIDKYIWLIVNHQLIAKVAYVINLQNPNLNSFKVPMFESKNIQNQLSFDDGLLTKVVDLGIRNNFD